MATTTGSLWGSPRPTGRRSCVLVCFSLSHKISLELSSSNAHDAVATSTIRRPNFCWRHCMSWQRGEQYPNSSPAPSDRAQRPVSSRSPRSRHETDQSLAIFGVSTTWRQDLWFLPQVNRNYPLKSRIGIWMEIHMCATVAKLTGH